MLQRTTKLNPKYATLDITVLGSSVRFANIKHFQQCVWYW